jgi:dual specificity phosphatase 12
MDPEDDSINKITDKIYLGDIDGSKNYKFLKENRINYVLSLAGEKSIEYDEKLKIKQKIIYVDDFFDVNIFQFFKECIEFIENADKVFVHCSAGVSRSATIVIAYFMYKEKKSYYEAYFFVKNKRKFISPNGGFVEQLLNFEKLLKENEYDLNKIKFK